MTPQLKSMILLLIACTWPYAKIHAQTETPAQDSTIVSPPDSSLVGDGDTIDSLIDTLAIDQPSLPALPPPVRLIDSLVYHFSRQKYLFDIKHNDLYPRNAAGFIYQEASLFTVTYHETPLRTIVFPFGLPTGQVNVLSGMNRMHPFDRVIPPDGRIDFDDISTGDILSSSIVEGPLAAYASPDGGLAMLYLEPFGIPSEVSKSEFTVERGPFGYALTRARIGRMFGEKLGFTFSTDYRSGEGLDPGADDDAYYVKSHVTHKFHRKVLFDIYASISRRKGGFPVLPFEGGYDFRRLRRDQQYIFSIIGQEIFGGQLTGRFEYQSSKAAYSSSASPIFRTIKPQYGELEIGYLLPLEKTFYRISITIGKEKYDIDQFYRSRDFGHVMFSGLIDRYGGRLFFFGRLRKAEQEDIGIEGAAGLNKDLVGHLKSQLSFGFLTRWPELIDRYAPGRIGAIGTQELTGIYHERGNPELEAEKKFSANAAIIFDNSRWHLSASLNAGLLDDVIYYDRKYDLYDAGEVYPDNDNIKFADLNLRISVDTLGPLFLTTSATGRRVDSDRYGDRPPYSPRWQLYGQTGLRYYIAKYQIRLRLFGDVTYTEQPLSYRMEKLETGALVTAGINLSLKDLTFYYMVHNLLDQLHFQPEGYGYTGWFYSWGINWKFLD